MTTKKRIASLTSVVFTVLAIVLFVLLCWTAAADAQGAIALFLYAPVLGLFLAAAFFSGRYAADGNNKSFGHYCKRCAQVFAIFLLLFYVSPMVGLHGLTDNVIGFVANSFKAVTGKTPMEWDKNL